MLDWQGVGRDAPPSSLNISLYKSLLPPGRPGGEGGQGLVGALLYGLVEMVLQGLVGAGAVLGPLVGGGGGGRLGRHRDLLQPSRSCSIGGTSENI